MTFLALANLIVAVLVLLALPFLLDRKLRELRVLLAPAAVAVVAGAVAIYGILGSPHLPDRPLDARAGDERRMDGLVAQAEARLAGNRLDAEAWRLLANAYGLARRYDDAALAMAEAAVLEPRDAGLLARYGEYIVLAHDGMVTPAARRVFGEALTIDPAEPVARFYGGIALAQSGNASDALVVWRELLEESPADSPWIGELRRHIADAEDLASRNADEVPPETGLSVTGMVEGLAARLEDEPDNLEGWRRLARSYTVLGDWPKAREAYAHALTLAPRDGGLWDGFAAAVAGAIQHDGRVPDAAREDMEHVLEVRPGNRHALYVTGLAAAGDGDAGTARERWTRLRDLFPAQSPEYRQVQVLLESLGD